MVDDWCNYYDCIDGIIDFCSAKENSRCTSDNYFYCLIRIATMDLEEKLEEMVKDTAA
jgi:hypothetical protein